MRTENKQIYAGTVSANGDSYSTPVNVKSAGEVVLFLDVTEVVGVGGLVVSLMTQDEISGKWFLIGNFSSKSAASTDITYIINGLGSSIACSWILTPGSQFTFALNASIKD